MATAAVKAESPQPQLAPNPQREGLQAAIARTVALKRDIEAAVAALAACETSLGEARDKLETARTVAAGALKAQAEYQIAMRTGTATGKLPVSPQAARDALEREQENIEALEACRDGLGGNLSKTRQSLSFAEMRLNDEISAFVQDHPETAVILARYGQVRRELRSLHVTLSMLRTRRCLSESQRYFDVEPARPEKFEPDAAWCNWLDRLTSDADAVKGE